MMKGIKHIVLFVLLILAGLKGFAQDVVMSDTGKSTEALIRHAAFKINPHLVYVNFKDAIANATELYNNGEYDTCIVLVQHSLRGWGSKMYQREALFELLVQCYLEKDDLPDADKAMVRLLHNDPHYETNDDGSNTEDFNNLANKYEVFPGFSIGARNTLQVTNYRSTTVYTDPNTHNPAINYSAPYLNTYKYYTMYYGWLEYAISKHWSIDMEGIRYNLAYNRTLLNTSNYYEGYSELMLAYKVPFYARRYFHFMNLSGHTSNFLAYLSGGIAIEHISTAIASAEYYDFSNNIINNVQNVSVLNMRTPNVLEYLLGGGFGYEIKGVRLFLDLRYYGGLSSFTNPAARMDNPQMLNTAFYIDNGAKFNQFEGGASIAFTLHYKVKKKKE